MNRLIILIRQFNKPLLICNLTFSALGVIFIIIYGTGTTGYSFIIKLLGYLSLTLYQFYFSNKSYFYFRNAGYSIRHMYIYTYGIDLATYIMLIISYPFLKAWIR
jgi:hypothetical protein